MRGPRECYTSLIARASAELRVRRLESRLNSLVLALFQVLSLLVWLLPWALMIGWIAAMADPEGRWPVTRALGAIGAPFLRLVTGLLPPIGALDVSPFILVLMSWIVGRLLSIDFFGF